MQALFREADDVPDGPYADNHRRRKERNATHLQEFQSSRLRSAASGQQAQPLGAHSGQPPAGSHPRDLLMGAASRNAADRALNGLALGVRVTSCSELQSCASLFRGVYTVSKLCLLSTSCRYCSNVDVA